jgi:hypothetical protein
MYNVLGAESCPSGDIWPAEAAAAANQKSPSKKPSINPPAKNLASSFRESFISSGKQGGGATLLGEGRDTVTRETCFPTSFSEHKTT